MVRNFSTRTWSYFWEADWRDGFFRLRINEGGVDRTEHLRFRQAVQGLLPTRCPMSSISAVDQPAAARRVRRCRR